MIPPMSGMHAIAAAMFGGKSIDDGSLLGLAAGGGAGGGVGSAGSGIQLLTKLGGGFVKRTSFPCPATSFPHLPPSSRRRGTTARQAILSLSPTGRDGRVAPVRAKEWARERRTR